MVEIYIYQCTNTMVCVFCRETKACQYYEGDTGEDLEYENTKLGSVWVCMGCREALTHTLTVERE